MSYVSSVPPPPPPLLSSPPGLFFKTGWVEQAGSGRCFQPVLKKQPSEEEGDGGAILFPLFHRTTKTGLPQSSAFSSGPAIMIACSAQQCWRKMWVSITVSLFSVSAERIKEQGEVARWAGGWKRQWAGAGPSACLPPSPLHRMGGQLCVSVVRYGAK